MGLPAPLEHLLGRLLISQKGHDTGLLSNTPAFTAHPLPTMPLTSPDCGPSHSPMADLYTGYGADRFPALTWDLPPSLTVVAEYVLIIEDPDAPLPWPITHGLFYAIPGARTAVAHEDLGVREVVGGKEKHLEGGFGWGRILGARLWGPEAAVGAWRASVPLYAGGAAGAVGCWGVGGGGDEGGDCERDRGEGGRVGGVGWVV
ncbi:hypothetical protein BU16DRAFT_623110 [Lophium mytilinum]|uniref:Uncharacterized protein n=1 Tax=Lophium mytilinum TaxID=390894 RepID=A0A6A6Q8Q7_9PEZI|nr:hypothetical protein BU16DRAFT_623110 [Lophium mytilinum]